jgi:hypothetical protein
MPLWLATDRYRSGRIVGSFTGDRLLGLVPSPVLLAIILVLLAVKVWRHK